ncbi:Pycsar system effector family protein [Nonomuraea cavernae]|uniref:Pycsar system effector family protein n=1 Tax=Nonomuraea cavernae TaxID=2045107 RepID=UPI0033E5F1DC
MLRRLLGGEIHRAAPQTHAARIQGGRLLSEAREELNRADVKAQVLLGVAGIGLGAVAAGLLAGTWSPLTLHNAVEWLWWVGVGATLASVGALAGAVYPRLGRPQRDGSLSFFGDVLRYSTSEEIATALVRSHEPDLVKISEQLLRISVIVGRKYRFIRWGCWLLLGGVVLALTALISDWLLRT